MVTSIVDDDSRLQGVLDSRRKIYFQTLPTNISPAEGQQRWTAFVLSLSQATTPPSTQKPAQLTQARKEYHPPPMLAAVPEVKRQRKNTDTSQHTRHVSLSRQRSSPLPPTFPSSPQEGLSPFGNTGAVVPTPFLRQKSSTKAPEQPQQISLQFEQGSPSLHRRSTSRPSQSISVNEYNPTDRYGPSLQMMSTNFSMSQPCYPSSSPPQPSPLLTPSSYSSFGATSFGESTNITSAEMSRQDSMADSSLYNNMGMMRLGSKASNSIPNNGSFMDSSRNEVRKGSSSSNSFEASARPADPFLAISETGAQFDRSDPTAVAPAMQRQTSSGSRQIHPKPIDAPAMSRTASSAERHEMIRIASSDGSFKDVIKISPSSSHVRQCHDRTVCLHDGCTESFKGDHEMRRHFERTHKERRRVFVCAPLADAPDFLSKTNCKHCREHKKYNEDYNAGEHLRRIHFNPKKSKSRRGNLKEEEKRGGKGGGTEPPMETLRNYMVSFDVDASGYRLSAPVKVNPASKVIVPDLTHHTKQFAEDPEVTSVSSSASTVQSLEFSNDIYEIGSLPIPAAQLTAQPRFAGNALLNFDQVQPSLTDNMHDVMNTSPIVGVSNDVEDQFSFDPNHPPDDLLNDPFFLAATQSEMFDFLSSFSSSSAS